MREASPSRLISSAARELFHPRGFFPRGLDLDLRTLDLGQASRTGLCQTPLMILIDREVLRRDGTEMASRTEGCIVATGPARRQGCVRCGEAVPSKSLITVWVAGAAFFPAHDRGRLAELRLGG